MAFVNEYIPPADLEKYAIEEVDRRYVVGGTTARDWTVDRARDIYLREVAVGKEEFRSHSTWTLYWHGTLIEVEIQVVGTSREPDGHMTGRKKLIRIEIPLELSARRDEILSDLREALTAYKDGGVYAQALTYSLTLDL